MDVPATPARHEPTDLVHGSLGRGQRNALDTRADDPLKPLDGEGEVSAALGRSDRVDLVEDEEPHGLEGRTRLRGQHEEERLGVVIRISGGRLAISARCLCGVSPVRTPTRSPRSMPASGARRFRSTS